MTTTELSADTFNVSQPVAAKIFSKFFSVIFHPLFIPLYVTAYMLFLHPDAFVGFSVQKKWQVLSIVFLNMCFFPLFTVALARALKFIDSLYLKTQKDRIIPLIACGIFFFWAFLVFREQSQYPDTLVSFTLGVFLAASAALIENIYQKVSLHAMGMGGWLGFMIVLLFKQSLFMAWPLAVVTILAGLVCSARLVLGSHTTREVYTGLITGALAQFIAAFFY